VLKHRLMLGPILALGVLAGLWLDTWLDALPTPEWLAWLLAETLPPGMVVAPVVALLSLAASWELTRILRDNGVPASHRVMSLSALAGLAATTLVVEDATGLRGAALVSAVATGVLLASLAFHSRNRTFEGVVSAAGGSLLAFVYLGLMAGLLVAIRREHSAWALLWVLTVTKSCDIGAYFSGRAFGRRRLIAWLSPGKTWEGLAGGVASAALVGALGLTLLGDVDRLSPGSALLWGAGVGGLLGLIGQGGDLAASLFKRDAGRKDSSRVLPGFGGIIDVIDSPLLVAPVAYWWLAWMSG